MLKTPKAARENSASLRVQLTLAFCAFILIGANDGAIGVLIPSIRAHYQVTTATVGTLFLCSSTGYLIAAFCSGPLAAKLGDRRFLLLGLMMILVGAGALTLMPPFLVFAPLLFCIGFGVAVLDAGLNAYIAHLPRSTALLNYLHAFYGVGALLGPVIASLLLTFGLAWNAVYVVWVVISLLLFLGIALTFKVHVSTQEKQEQHKDNVLVTILKMRVVWLAALFLFVYVGIEVSLGSWSYSLLTVDRHTPTLFAGWTVSGYWFGLTIGRLALGKLALRIGEERMIAGCVLGAALGVLLVWLLPVPVVAAIGLFCTGFCLGPLFPTTIALMSKVIASRWLTATIGFLASLGAGGGALFPWLAGNLAQVFGFWSLLPYAIVLTLLMLSLWLLLQRQAQSRLREI